ESRGCRGDQCDGHDQPVKISAHALLPVFAHCSSRRPRHSVVVRRHFHAASSEGSTRRESSVMNWRRLVSSIGSSPEPAVPAYGRVRVQRKRPAVLGIDLNRSESSPLGETPPCTPSFAQRRLWNVRAAATGSLRPDVSRPDHLRPLLCFIRNELAKIGRRAAK